MTQTSVKMEKKVQNDVSHRASTNTMVNAKPIPEIEHSTNNTLLNSLRLRTISQKRPIVRSTLLLAIGLSIQFSIDIFRSKME